MQRNCIFCLTLIRDSLFFLDCKRRFVQTNLTKLPLTKHSFPLVWCLQQGILFCFNTIYATGFLLLCWTTWDEREELSYKTTATSHFHNFKVLPEFDTKYPVMSHVSVWIWRPVWWALQQPLTCNGFMSVYRWQQGLHLASSGNKSCACVTAYIHARGATSCYSIWSG